MRAVREFISEGIPVIFRVSIFIIFNKTKLYKTWAKNKLRKLITPEIKNLFLLNGYDIENIKIDFIFEYDSDNKDNGITAATMHISPKIVLIYDYLLGCYDIKNTAYPEYSLKEARIKLKEILLK